MIHVRRRLLAVVLIVAGGTLSGCVYTVAGSKPEPIAAQPLPAAPPSVEYTVGDFAFTLEGGKMITSAKAGSLLNDAIMKAWKERGYIRAATEVDAGAFSHGADYEITLSGSQYGDSSIVAQILCGLTLFVLPYSVTQDYDVQYTLVDVKGGQTYGASVEATNEAWFELFLLFALPVAQRGHEETMRRMGDHLYRQLSAQGAFPRGAPVPAVVP